jgi:hypothetical protein
MTENGDPTHEEIARRAHEISQRGEGGGSDEENWLRAEEELRADRAPAKKPRKRAAPKKSEPPVREAE